jgi:transposase
LKRLSYNTCPLYDKSRLALYLPDLCVTISYQSGDGNREQGIDKAGNRHIRAIAIEIAWPKGLRHQPDSALSRWYQERFGHGNSRMRRIGIVALARKLLIALWRYLETGQIPEGAVLKPA